MVPRRLKSLGVNLLLPILVCVCLLTDPAQATSRGITVQSRTASGASEQIRLYSEYCALVVGCGQYTRGWPPLPNPVKDAKEVAALLKSLGWRVDVLMDPPGAKLRRELNRLVTGVGRQKDNAILLWFSGHGQTIEEADGTKLGYLVPVDAPDPDKDLLGFMEKAISMRQIETVSKQIRAKHVLMAFDSCFSGAIFQMVRTKPSPYIQQKVTYPVRQFITAGREDEQVPDRSVFKEVFIQGIKEGFADLNQDRYVTGEELGSYMQEQVTNYSRNAQHPQFGKINNPRLDKGDFVFVLEPSAEQPQVTEDEKPKLAAIPKEVQQATVSLRTASKELSQLGLKRMLLKYRFFDSERLPYGDFANDFIDNGNGTVTDRATGLVWQQKGSIKSLARREATRYVEKLNKERFGGSAEWRMPTIEELASLLDSAQTNGHYIDTVFDRTQKICWSADWLPEGSHLYGTATSHYIQVQWAVNFGRGYISYARWVRTKGPWGTLGSEEGKYCHVRAVRSLK